MPVTLTHETYQMKNLIFILSLTLLLTNSFTAQVKIGNNPNSIDPNSLFEMETTNKGFLPPRVALNSANSATPLTAPVPAGMMVYSSGGTLSNGFYSWDGSKWVMLGSSTQARTNFVRVQSASDLPAASGGVITLSAGVLYEINGSISVSSKIDLNGCYLKGIDAVNDKLIYTGSGELFTGSNGGCISYLTITAASGKVFNINGGGANKNLVVQNCYMIGCNEIGTIQGIGGTVFFSKVAYFYNSNGVTYTNNQNVVIDYTLWDASNHNTYEKFTGTFNIIQLLGGDRLTSSANSAVALDVSGVSTLVSGSVKTIMFVGSGSYATGSFSKEWEVESQGVSTEKDDIASGNLYISSATSTTFSAINTSTKILGTTTAASLFRVTSPANNRLTYSGTKSKRFTVICSLSSIATGNNKNFTFYIAKNGVVLPESKQYMKCSSQVDRGSITLSCTALLTTNDYIEVWVENNTDTTSISIESLNLAIK
jgi:hypothetical protein